MNKIMIALIFWLIGWWGGIYITEYMDQTAIIEKGETDHLFFDNIKVKVIK